MTGVKWMNFGYQCSVVADTDEASESELRFCEIEMRNAMHYLLLHYTRIDDALDRFREEEDDEEVDTTELGEQRSLEREGYDDR